MRILLRVLVALVVLLGLGVALDYALPATMARGFIKVQHAAAHLEAKQTSIPGFEIAYLEGGSGEPLVLVHGFGADKDNFSQVAMWLTKHYRVIAIDLPGFGDSSKPVDAGYSISAQVSRLDQILDALHLDKVHLGGSSMGGWIVASYAGMHSERVQSLWLLAAAGVATARESELRRIYRETRQIGLVARTHEEFANITKLVFTNPPFVPHSVLWATAERAIANHDLHARIFERLADSWEAESLEPRVKGLQTPTLVMWGDQDRAVDVSSVDVLRALMPNTQAVIYPGMGHLPMLEAPRQSALDYLKFRESLGITAPASS